MQRYNLICSFVCWPQIMNSEFRGHRGACYSTGKFRWHKNQPYKYQVPGDPQGTYYRRPPSQDWET